MKSFLLLTFIVTAFTGFCQQNCLVIRVVDGDTYKVLLNGKLITVRLVNADTLEIGQYFGKAAKDSVTALIQNLVVKANFYKKDLYGRCLAAIQVNGMSLDSFLIAKGWAFYYYKYSLNTQLAVYEASAKLKGSGIWECLNIVPPWIWRKLSKQNKRIYEVCRPLPSIIQPGHK